MNRILGPLARLCATHPWRALLLWVVGAATAFSLAAAVGAPAQEDWDAPGTPSQRGVDLLRAHLPEAGNASAQVVVRDRRGASVPQGELTALDERLGALPHVLAVDPPRVASDGATVLLTVRYDVPVTHRDLMGHVEPLEAAVASTRASGLQVALGGELPATAQAPVKGTGQAAARLPRDRARPRAVVADQDVDLARRSRAALAPYADRITLAGAAACFGPVSGYLALAAATTGDREAARQYATAALDTATRWGWHAYVVWLDDARARMGL